MQRRRFILGGLALLGMWHTAAAQQRGRLPRVGVILAHPIPNSFMEGFQRGMDELGYVAGQNVHIDYRSAEGSPDRFPALAAELIRLGPDVIVAGGGSVRAVKNVSSTIPIVFPAQPDPVAMGLVKTLARPGGNATGISMLESDISAKRLELLRELLPRVQRVAVLRDPRILLQQADAIQTAARTLGIEVRLLSARPEEFEAAFEAARKARSEALIVLPSASFSAQRQRLVDLAAKNGMITMYEYDGFPLDGGLISYGANFPEMYRTAARYVDKILKGAKPADLPVEQATKFELVINLRTARALGLPIPPSLLVRADRVIE
jgi:putative tryptophan/tyrosine transport system substrate-binding protein